MNQTTSELEVLDVIGGKQDTLDQLHSRRHLVAHHSGDSCSCQEETTYFIREPCKACVTQLGIFTRGVIQTRSR